MDRRGNVSHHLPDVGTLGPAMKLYVSPATPFGRLTRIVLREKGLEDRVEEVIVNPYEDPADLIAANPVGQVPALLRDDGDAIIDSRLIAAWLDHLESSAPALLPAGGPERMAVRNLEALAASTLDKGVALLMEKRRPADVQYDTYINRWTEQTLRGVAALPLHIETSPAPVTLGTLMAGCLLDWLDFRHPNIGWRDRAPTLVSWLAEMKTRPSFAATEPS